MGVCFTILLREWKGVGAIYHYYIPCDQPWLLAGGPKGGNVGFHSKKRSLVEAQIAILL